MGALAATGVAAFLLFPPMRSSITRQDRLDPLSVAAADDNFLKIVRTIVPRGDANGSRRTAWLDSNNRNQMLFGKVTNSLYALSNLGLSR